MKIKNIFKNKKSLVGFTVVVLLALAFYNFPEKYYLSNDFKNYQNDSKIPAEGVQDGQNKKSTAGIPSVLGESVGIEKQQAESQKDFFQYLQIKGDSSKIGEIIISSQNIAAHAIEARNIDSNSITSRTIKSRTIISKDLARHLTIQRLTVGQKLITDNAEIGAIDFGENSITDGTLTGNWNFGSGNIATTGIISGVFDGAFAPSGDVDMANHIMTNIGNAGTDFDALGGLNLANALTVTTGGISATGNSNITGNLTVTALNTGQGNYELYAMDQNVLTSSSPAFAGLALNGQLTSNIISGTAPFVITSNTLVINLNADMADGYHFNQNVLVASSPTFAGLTLNGQITSNVVSGTAPFIIASNTLVYNLNADYLDGQHGAYYAPLANLNGTQNYIARFTGTNTIGDSVLYETGGNFGIGTTNPVANFDLAGTGWLRGAAGGTKGLYVSSTGSIGIGRTNPRYLLDAEYYQTDSAAPWNARISYANNATGSLSDNTSLVLTGGLINNSSKTITTSSAVDIYQGLSGDFTTVTNSRALFVQSWIAYGMNTVNVQNMLGVEVQNKIGSGSNISVNDSYGIRIDSPDFGAGTTLRNYGLYIQDQSNIGGGTLSNTFNFYSAGANSKNYFAGNVGIGTTNPGVKLDVVGQIQSAGSLAGLVFTDRADSAKQWQWYSSGDIAHLWRNGFGDLINVKNDGNVGIGTTSPLSTLDVNGSIRFGSYAIATLPAAGIAGQIARVTDGTRGIWMDQGSQWFQLGGNIADVKEFGAKGDGATDDTAAIQAAIDSLPADGGEVKLSCGATFLISDTIQINKKVYFYGCGQSETTGAAGSTTIMKSASLDDPAISVTGSGSKSILERFIVDGKVGNGGDGIQIITHGVTLRNISVYNQGRDGIRIGYDSSGTNSNLWVMDTVVSNNNGRHGVYIHDNKTGPDANAGMASNLFVSGNSSDGLKVDKAWYNSFQNVVAEGNTGAGVRLTGNTSDNYFFGGDLNEGNSGGNLVIESGAYANKIYGTTYGNTTGADSGDFTVIVDEYMSKLGQAGIGTWPSNASFAMFGNRLLDQTQPGNYGLLQSSLGQTYLNSGSGQSINFRINNSDQMVLSSAGSLDVNGVVRADGASAFATGAGAELYYLNGESYLNSYDRSGGIFMPLVLSGSNISLTPNGGSSALYVKSGGNVGIGTTDPQAALDMGTGGIRLGGITQTSWPASSSQWVTNGSNIGYILGSVGIGTTNPTYNLQVAGTLGIGGTAWFGGNVGIGEVSPGAKLSVSGGTAIGSAYDTTAVSDGNLLVGSSIGIGTTSFSGYSIDIGGGNPSIHFQPSTNETAIYSYYQNGGGMFMGVERSTGGAILTNASPYAGVIGTTTSYPLQFGTNHLVKMTLDTNGKLGIGTTAPSYALDVIVSGTGPIARFANDSDNSSCAFGAGGILTCTSDIRLKKNIADSNYGLNEVMGLRPVEFNWKSQSSSSQKTIGFIAQDVEGFLPQLVITDANGYKELNTIGMVPILVKGMQEQQASIVVISNSQLQMSNQIKITNDQIEKLSDSNVSVNDKITIIGTAMSGQNEILTQLQDSDASLINNNAQQEKRIKDLEDQIKMLQDMNQAVIDFTKVFDPKLMVYKDSMGNINLADGKITAKDIDILGTLTVNEIDTEVLGVSSEKTSGKATLPAGETKIKIETPYASDEAKIIITPRGSTQSKTLYYDDVVLGESFKVKIDDPSVDKDINFTWLIIK